MADPTLVLEIDTPSAAAGLGYLIIGDATNGLIDTGLIAPDLIWVDRAAKSRTITINRGMSRFDGPIFRSDAGTLTSVLDNRTRIFDPAASADIVPDRSIRSQAVLGATTYDMFTGIVHAWELAYPTKSSTGDATTTVAANDGIGQLTSLNVVEDRPSESTGARIQALANIVGWPASLTSIDPGVTIMPSAGQTVSAWSAMLEAADSEMGELYVEADGTLTFRDRNRIVSEARSRTSQATFGDNPGELKFSDVQLSFNDSLIRNQVTITYDDAGDSVTAADSASQQSYGVWSYALQVKITDPNTVASYARFLVALYAQPTPQFTSLVIQPRRDGTNLWPQVLGRKLGDRITVAFQPPGGGSRISHDCFIRGIQHVISPGFDWVTTFTLQDASAWPSVFLIDSSNIDSSDVIWF